MGTEQEAVNIEPEQLQTNSTAPDLVSEHKNAKKNGGKLLGHSVFTRTNRIIMISKQRSFFGGKEGWLKL